jgi:hypothetical protein
LLRDGAMHDALDLRTLAVRVGAVRLLPLAHLPRVRVRIRTRITG